MCGDERVAEPGEEYAWLTEISDDGDAWRQEHHPVDGRRDSGGLERAVGPEVLAREVLARRFAALGGDEDYDWEELWFRVTVWDYRRCVDHAGWQPPYLPQQSRVEEEDYGRYLQVHHAEPNVVEVRVPRQVRDAVWHATSVPRALSAARAHLARVNDQLSDRVKHLEHGHGDRLTRAADQKS